MKRFLSVVAMILVLNVLLLFHEAGHFIALKAFGAEVDELAFGYKPRLVSFTLPMITGTTELSVNLLPIGAYVKPN